MFTSIRDTFKSDGYKRTLEHLVTEQNTTQSDEIKTKCEKTINLIKTKLEVVENRMKKLQESVDIETNKDKEFIESILSMPWKKIPQKYQLQQIEKYLKKKYSREKLVSNLYAALAKRVSKKKLVGKKYIVYDSDKMEITDIPCIVYENKKYRIIS